LLFHPVDCYFLNKSFSYLPITHFTTFCKHSTNNSSGNFK